MSSTSSQRIPKSASHLLQCGVLLAIAACSAQQSGPPAGASTGAGLKRNSLAAIRAEAKRIDAAVDSPGSSRLRPLQRDAPHWEFSGFFEKSAPVFLTARFSEGQVERQETYYLRGGKLLLVRVEKWWDVDVATKAPEPKTVRQFYIVDDRTIHSVVEVASSPPRSRRDDTSRPATALVERSGLIARLLLGATQDPAAVLSLDDFPDAGIP